MCVDGARLLVNGEPVHLTGFGVHEAHQTIGKAHNNALMLRDAACLEWIGANSLRTPITPTPSTSSTTPTVTACSSLTRPLSRCSR
ncbi:hypothetical protein E5345_09635 [Propionibacterium sp. NM47_B9-13]|nr:hypothetical protein E5345_09635 [Propionibacterium sp. NM47_B9-13]